MVGDTVVVFEGLSFLTLLMFHYFNFKQQAPGAVAITTENVHIISKITSPRCHQSFPNYLKYLNVQTD